LNRDVKRRMTASDPVVGAAGKQSSCVIKYKDIVANFCLCFNDFSGKEESIEQKNV